MEFKRGTYGYIALKDLRTAVVTLNAESYDQAVVSSQQALEKIFKELLKRYIHDSDSVELLRSHKLIRLSTRLLELVPQLNNYREELREIGDAYFETRYPGVDYIEYDREDATRLVNVALDIFKIIEDTEFEADLVELGSDPTLSPMGDMLF